MVSPVGRLLYSRTISARTALSNVCHIIFKVAQSVASPHRTSFSSSILNGKEPNFEEHSNVHFVCDAPTYTMYKITNGTVRELFSTEDVDSCKAMDYIETLCGVLRG